MEVKVTQVYDNEWHPLMKVGGVGRIVCCSCGLTHTLKVRTRKGFVEINAVRDLKFTEQVRKDGKQKWIK